LGCIADWHQLLSRQKTLEALKYALADMGTILMWREMDREIVFLHIGEQQKD